VSFTVLLGSAGVSPAVFGVAPVGATPTGSTETVALPIALNRHPPRYLGGYEFRNQLADAVRIK